jgi:hypothetical protein
MIRIILDSYGLSVILRELLQSNVQLYQVGWDSSDSIKGIRYVSSCGTNFMHGEFLIIDGLIASKDDNDKVII